MFRDSMFWCSVRSPGSVYWCSVFRCSVFWCFWKCYMPSFHTQVYKWIPVRFNTGVHLIQEGTGGGGGGGRE